MSNTLRFLLNGEPMEVRDVDPHTSVLQFVREHRHLKGTKEGCNEGDCGACTVALVELDANDELQVNPINACIRLLPTLHGKAIFTVEALSNDASFEALHPVQQAMVECHASQCGFCTPGFVMTLFALFKNEAAPSRERICDAISGNLCRCTGYRPIIDAALQATSVNSRLQRGDKAEKQLVENNNKNHIAPIKLELNEKSWKRIWLQTPAANAGRDAKDSAAQRAEQTLVATLKALRSDATLDYAANAHRFIAPMQMEELSSLIEANPDAWILGGGTDIGLWINKALQHNATIVYTGEVAALKTIREIDDGIEIGAAVSLENAFRAMNRIYPELAHVWTRFASWPVRTSGTLGGNVANGSPIGDSMPALIALGAHVVLRKGLRTRMIPLEALYLDYKKQSREAGEWIEAIHAPFRRAGLQLASYKNSKRNEQDISAVCAAIALTIDRNIVTDARIAYGGMAGIPKRATNAEAALVGNAWTESAVRNAMHAMTKDFTPMSDMRASAEYRMQIAQHHLLRFWFESRGEMNAIEARVF